VTAWIRRTELLQAIFYENIQALVGKSNPRHLRDTIGHPFVAQWPAEHPELHPISGYILANYRWDLSD
jgi:hypothetical protein